MLSLEGPGGVEVKRGLGRAGDLREAQHHACTVSGGAQGWAGLSLHRGRQVPQKMGLELSLQG